MHAEAANECVGTGWGIAQIASTVYDLGIRNSAMSASIRALAGERGRGVWRGGVGAITVTGRKYAALLVLIRGIPLSGGYSLAGEGGLLGSFDKDVAS